jgi:hypothetical protein
MARKMNIHSGLYTISTMRIRVHRITAAILLAGCSASGQQAQWIRTGSYGSSSYSSGVSADNSGNIYVAGKYSGGSFIRRYSPSGTIQWDKTTSASILKSLGDATGSVYVLGNFTGSVSFEGNTLQSSSPSFFLVRYTASGSVAWAKKRDNATAADFCMDQAGQLNVAAGKSIFRYSSSGSLVSTVSLNREATLVRVDNSGNFLIRSSVDEGEVIRGETCNGPDAAACTAVRKYSPSGSYLWGRIAAHYTQTVSHLEVDALGNVYSCGLGGRYTDHYVLKYAPTGETLWKKFYGGSAYDDVNDIRVLPGGSFYTTGSFWYNASFGATSLNGGESTAFLAKFDAEGLCIWAVSLSGSGDPSGNGAQGLAVAVDRSSYVYLAGSLFGTVQSGGVTAKSTSARDACLVRFADSTAGKDLVAVNSGWKYLDNGNSPGTAWRESGYSDASWKTGNAELGYGDGDEATVIGYGSDPDRKHLTSYFRKTFTASRLAAEEELELGLLADDGAVVYINGSEVYRKNMPSGSVASSTRASATVNGSGEQEFTTVRLSGSMLTEGLNTVAVEVHQADPSSSDLSFNLRLAVRALSQDPQLIGKASAGWRYRDDGQAPPPGWKELSFNDAAWKSGKAQLGYGDGDEATLVSYGPDKYNKYITTYFRKSFNVSNPSAFSALGLELMRDDGAVVYMNGNEIFRSNMSGATLDHTTRASAYVDGAAENVYLKTVVSAQHLVAGTNVVAVEIHQSSSSSSDISFDLSLSGSASAQQIGPAVMEDPSTGEEPDNQAVQIKIQPNPFREELNVVFSLTRETSSSLEVYDITGRLVAYFDEAHLTGNNRYVLHPSSLGMLPGVYFLRLTIGEETFTSKVVCVKDK